MREREREQEGRRRNKGERDVELEKRKLEERGKTRVRNVKKEEKKRNCVVSET